MDWDYHHGMARCRPQGSDVAGSAPSEDACSRWKVERDQQRGPLTPRPQPLVSLSPPGSIPFPQTSRTNDSSCWTNAGPWGQHAIYPSVAGFGGDAGIRGIPAVMTVIHTGWCVFGMFEDGSSAKSMSVQGHLFNLFPVFSRSNFDGLFFLLVKSSFSRLLIQFTPIFVNLLNSTVCLLYVCTVLLCYVLRCG